MKNKNVDDEFVVGKHNIGWIDSDFNTAFAGQSFAPHAIGNFKKFDKYMENADMIERELNPGRCDLGDVLAFLENPPEGTKDGYFNLFLVGDKVVSVRWRSGHGFWSVCAWRRAVSWYDASRVFSLGLGSQSFDSEPSNTLTLESAIEICKKAGLQVVKVY